MATNPRRIGALTRTLADEVREQRLSRRLKQEEVSAATGIPVNTLSKIERGQTAVDMEQIDSLAKAFGLLPEELMALARQHAKEREAQQDGVYLSAGTFDPATTQGRTPSSQHLDELRKRRPSAD